MACGDEEEGGMSNSIVEFSLTSTERNCHQYPLSEIDNEAACNVLLLRFCIHHLLIDYLGFLKL